MKQIYRIYNAEGAVLVKHNPLKWSTTRVGKAFKTEKKANEIFIKVSAMDPGCVLREISLKDFEAEVELHQLKKGKAGTPEPRKNGKERTPRGEEILFKKGLNEICKACTQDCKQSIVATIEYCPQHTPKNPKEKSPWNDSHNKKRKKK